MQTIESICICTAQKMGNLDQLERSSGWVSTSLSHGYPGLISLFTEMDHYFPRDEWREIRHGCIQHLIAEVKKGGMNQASSFSGTGGICYALDFASQENPYYIPLLEKFHTQLLKEIRISYLQTFQKIKIEQCGYPSQLYDLISGLSGLLPYLLRQSKLEGTHPIILETLSALVDLTKPIPFEGNLLPGWVIPAKYKHLGEPFAHGCLDTGLAHGISGVLIALAKASLQNITVKGQEEAMKTIVTWLQSLQMDLGPLKSIWPSRFGVEQLDQGFEKFGSRAYRDGWCYGAPGIAMALFIASHALRDAQLYEYAIKSMENVSQRILSEDVLKCLSFCHGYAGVLTIIHQMYLATHNPLFLKTSKHITSLIQKRYNEHLPFGFKSFIPVNAATEEELDSASFIGGSTGILHALLFSKSKTSRPWLQLFLLA